MTLEEAIEQCERLAIQQGNLSSNHGFDYGYFAERNNQLAEWLRELKQYREFADWLVKAVLEEDWEESADFYVEVLCRKLTKLGKLKVVDNKYMEVNADDK